MIKDSTVKDLDQLHTQGRTSRGKLEGTWFLNLSFFYGAQWNAWDGRQLYRPDLRRGRITVTDNRITPIVRTEVAKIQKMQPVWTVTPRTGDEEDANAAELAELLMRFFWKHLHMGEKVTDALLWSRVCCAGFLKPFWDPSVGESVEVLTGPSGQILTAPDTGAPIRNNTPDAMTAMAVAQQQGQPVNVKKIAQGDIRIESRSPFQMVFDPLAEVFSEAEWAIEETVKSQDYVQRRYNKEVEADAPANPGLIEARMAGSPSMLSTGSGSGGYKGVKVREYWCRPNVTHPQGRRVVWVKNQILFEDDKPFDPFPYVMLSGIPAPGRLWPMSIVEHLRPVQTELNKVKSQIAENRNRIGNPTVLASRQAVKDPENLADNTALPGGVVWVDEIGSNRQPVQYLPAPDLPAYVIESIQSIEESIQEISGQHEVTSAQVPPGVTAASAINLLQEADDTRLGPAVKDYEQQLGALGQKVLNLAAKYYNDTRTIRLAGEDGQWQIQDFRGSMLRNNTDVEVQAGSSFPQSKAAKQAAMQDLLVQLVQSGNPPHGRQLAQWIKDMEIGDISALISEYDADENQVRRENSRMMAGIPQPINEWDDDDYHIKAHQDEQKSSRYDQLPPPIKQILEDHVQQHRARVASVQQAQMQLQMQAQGQPPPDQQGAQMQMDLAGQQQQLQGQAAQQAGQQAQAQQQLAGTQQQQGLSQAQAEQAQRHAEEKHQQDMRHKEALQAVKLMQTQQQAQAQARGAQGGRR